MFHEIFNEPERAEVLAQLIRWLTRLDAATP
jgi:alpha-beta hydrolase superfamily lysophospholipase